MNFFTMFGFGLLFFVAALLILSVALSPIGLMILLFLGIVWIKDKA